MNATVSSPFTTLSHQDLIAQRARELWHARGRPEGQDLAIWCDAERDLVRRRFLPASYLASTRPDSSLAGADLDTSKVVDRLSAFGESADRSATSLNPTR